jgi:peptidoglycan/LPS O-acetylase OafA/YrhL
MEFEPKILSLNPSSCRRPTTGRPAVLSPLTSLRFFAALLVFAWHDPFIGSFTGNFESGFVGVGFFFLLSGFILTYVHHTDFAGRLSASAVRRFYLARFARIYPLHIAAMLIAIAVMAFSGQGLYWNVPRGQQAIEVVLQALLVQAWFPQQYIHLGANNPSWSISTEVCFYALFPLLAYLCNRYVARLSLRGIAAAALGVWLAALCFAAAHHGYDDGWQLYVFPASRLADFALGMLLGAMFLQPRRVAVPLGATTLELLAIGLAALAMATLSQVPMSLRYSVWMMPWLALLVIVFAAGRGGVSRALAHPACVRLGEMSFAFYLIHLSTIYLVGTFYTGCDLIETGLSLSIALGASYVLFLCVEDPARRWIRAAADRAGPREVPAVGTPLPARAPHGQ